MHSLAGCFDGRSHDDENIRRFYPESLGQYFFRDSGLVYDSEPEAPNGPFGLRRAAEIARALQPKNDLVR